MILSSDDDDDDDEDVVNTKKNRDMDKDEDKNMDVSKENNSPFSRSLNTSTFFSEKSCMDNCNHYHTRCQFGVAFR